MNNKFNNVQKLYEDANSLYKTTVQGTADTIIDDLAQGINTLKKCWEGKDAGVQIQNIVEVHNAMVVIRNALAELAKDSSAVAANYRQIQNANRAGLESLAPITTDSKNSMGAYQDNRDSVNITSEAMNGKNKVDTANGTIDTFISSARSYHDEIMNNWQAGTGRDKAENAFSEFMNNSEKYKLILEDVSVSISEAIRNYNF